MDEDAGGRGRLCGELMAQHGVECLVEEPRKIQIETAAVLRNIMYEYKGFFFLETTKILWCSPPGKDWLPDRRKPTREEIARGFENEKDKSSGSKTDSMSKGVRTY